MDGLGDPFEQAFEAESFEVQDHRFALAFGEVREMNPDAEIAD